MTSIFLIFFSSLAYAQETSTVGMHEKRAKDSFNELSDISRNISKILEKATRDGDMERVQCIRSRQASISALVDISGQAQKKIQSSLSQSNMLRADSELRKITVSLSKAKQFSSEVEACLASQVSQTEGAEKTKVDVDKSGVAELILGDESQFGLDTVENKVYSLDSDGSDSMMSSEDTPPPPPTSPYE